MADQSATTDTLTVLVIAPNGDVREDVLPTRDTLHGLYELIDCRLVDLVRLEAAADMWLDDEGLYAAEINHPATAVARAFGFVHQPYFGTVVITGGADDKGNTAGLLPKTAARLRALLAR